MQFIKERVKGIPLTFLLLRQIGYYCFMLRIVLILLLFSSTIFHTSAMDLSDSARVSLLKVSPGQELYSAFGHTGIRVTDYKKGFDVVFNYGTFDFAQEGFYINFCMGKMLYMMTIDRFDDFVLLYEKYEHRGVVEQELNLSTADKQAIFKYLDWNAHPDNREYRYDFFWDNCSTRPRDVFEKQLGARLKYDYTGFDTTKTMRETLKPYVANMPWVDFGFDLILGMPCEIQATPRHQTFLPDKLEKAFDKATVNGLPLVTAKRVIVDIPFKPKPFEGPTPILVMFGIMMFALLLGLIERWKNIHFWWFDFIVFFAFGLQGTIFLFLGLFSEHYSVPWNLNCMWLIPTHFIVAFFLFKKRKPKWMMYYFCATAILMLILLAIKPWHPQPYGVAVVALILLAANRAISIFVRLKQQSLVQQKSV